MLSKDIIAKQDYENFTDLVFWVVLIFMLIDSIQNCFIVYLFKAFLQLRVEQEEFERERLVAEETVKKLMMSPDEISGSAGLPLEVRLLPDSQLMQDMSGSDP